MITKKRIAAVWVCLASTCLLLCAEMTVGENGCEKARQAYQRGAELLNYQERLEAFQTAVDMCPSYVEAHVNLADAFENLRQFEQAEKHYRQALAYRPDYHIPYIGLGEIYLKTGRFSLARGAYEKGLEIAPENERLSDDLKVVEERLRREKSLFRAEQIESCLVEDEEFRLMCMCPETHYEYLKHWICIPPIFFPTESSRLSSEARQQLDEIGKALKSAKLADRTWLVIGQRDSLGDPEYNLQLSKQRAAAVKQYLTQHHRVRPKCLNLKFLGQDFPRASNNTTGGRSENRRVEIIRDRTQP